MTTEPASALSQTAFRSVALSTTGLEPVTAVAIVDVSLTKAMISDGLAATWAKIAASGTGLFLNFLARKYLVFPGKKIRDWK